MSKIEQALYHLNRLIDKGWEFPEAIDKTAKIYKLSLKQFESLKKAYDDGQT